MDPQTWKVQVSNADPNLPGKCSPGVKQLSMAYSMALKLGRLCKCEPPPTSAPSIGNHV